MVPIIMSGKDFGSCLEAFEAHADQKIALGARASAAIFDNERVLCGLKNGDVCLLIMGKDIAKLESPSARSQVTFLCWAGTDKCISGHMRGPSRLWDLAELRETAVLDAGDREPEEFDKAAAVDASGRVVLGSSSGRLRLWELGQIKQVAKVEAHPEAINKVCVVDGKCFTGAHKVKVWDLSTLQALATLEKESSQPGVIEFSQKGHCLFSDGNLIKVWSLSEKKVLSCYKGHSGLVTLIKPIDDDRCASGGGNGEVKIWNMKDLSDICQFQFPGIYYFEVKKNLLFCALGYGLGIVDLKSNQIAAELNLKIWMLYAHSFKEQCICIPEEDSYATILEIDQYQQVYELEGHTDGIRGMLAWGSDKLVSWSSDATLRVWNVNKYRELAVLKGHSNSVSCAALATDDRCVSGDEDGNFKVWNLSSMEEIPTSMKHSACVTSVVVTSDRKAITGDGLYNIFVWDLGSYAKIGELQGHFDRVNSLCLISDEVVVSGSHDKTVRVWDIRHFTALATLEGHQKLVGAVAKASRNRCISVSDDGIVKVWDLQKYELLASLCGHSGEVWSYALTGEKCASGSNDGTLVFWNLTNYSQEAKVVFSLVVTRLLFINSTQLISGDASGAIKVWEDFREIASFKGIPEAVWGLAQLSNSRLAAYRGGLNHLQIFDLGQLSNCLSQCSNREILEKEISERKPLLPQYRSRVSDFKNGKKVPQPESQMLIRPYFFNALHLCAYYDHSALLREYLGEGVPLIRGAFGSPLTLALERKTIECVDALLEHLIAVAPSKHAWKSFQTINDELLGLLGCGSSLLEAFFSVLMQRPSLPVPNFINPLIQLPAVLFAPHFYMPDLGIFTVSESGDDLVKFAVSLVHWNYIAGSQQSVDLLTAATECESRRVLLGDYFRSIISEKWENCYPFTLCVATAYGLMLACLMGTINLGLEVCCISYLVLNCLFLLYELLQFAAMRSKYFTEGWNLIDMVRGTLSILWASFTLMNYSIVKHMVMVVVLLDFIRGFTHFRSFRMTRIFVYMTFTVVAEMYSFLLIIAYSIFGFGILTSVLIEENSISETWKKAYNLAMGNFDTASYGTLEWIVFTGATVTNIVIMMNLLISILGDAYQNVQMTLPENDLHMQASLLLEYETLMTWRRKEVSKMWVVTCRNVEGGDEHVKRSEKAFKLLSEKLSQMAEESNRKAAKIEKKIAGIEDIKVKVDSLEGKLDAVLNLLQSRS